MLPPKITIKNIKEARRAFEQNEPRDLFYRAARVLVDLSLDRKIKLTLAESIAVLLQTWNKAYYRFRKFDNEHYCDIEKLFQKHLKSLCNYRKLTIKNLGDDDEQKIMRIFKDFEIVLGPVGAPKSLHLIAPSIFPLWDRAIAAAYNTPLKKSGNNAYNYVQFLWATRQQCVWLRKQGKAKDLLKSIDEYNYCKYTKKWI